MPTISGAVSGLMSSTLWCFSARIRSQIAGLRRALLMTARLKEADICKSSSILAVTNSVSGNLGSGEEIIAYNRLEIGNGLRVSLSSQERVSIMNTK